MGKSRRDLNKKMWPFRKKKEEKATLDFLQQIGGMLNELQDSHTKLLNDQRSLRGLVNRKMGNRLKDEYDEDQGVSGSFPLDPQVQAFCEHCGVDWRSNLKEIKASEEFIKETHEFKGWAQGQN